MTVATNSKPLPRAASARALEGFHLVAARLLGWLQQCGDGRVPGARFVVDGSIVLLSFFAAYLVRYNFVLSRSHLLQFLLWAPILVLARLLLVRAAGVHRFIWRFVCLSDSIAIARALLLPTVALLLVRWLYPAPAPLAYWLRLPLGIIVPEFLLTLGGVLTVRSICRIAQERSDRRSPGPAAQPKRVLLYGAGRAGVMLARELASHGDIRMLGFLDDDPGLRGTVIAGLTVLGAGDRLPQLVSARGVDEVMISIAAPPPGAISRILSQCKALSVRTTIVPAAEEIIRGRVRISRVREVRIEDLLGRASAATGECAPQVRAAYQGKRVLVTGAGGSIGSELCRQLLQLRPARLAILDKDENSIYDLEQELRYRDPGAAVETMIADIKIRERLQALFADFLPEVVLHAAAHKHVPLMEKHPCEAVLNNVMGMQNLLEACRAAGVERFVFISSDKAVNPTNVMGATKRAGEKLLQLCTADGGMKAAAVRFGNVMGSRGSVIPLFQRQIEQGGPVTVTHPDIVRFFMTIPEAVQLVLCAGSLGRQCETFVLDMGNPRRVLDLARQMIELAGLVPGGDIPIAITGLRPGEKMEEELAYSGELLIQTQFQKISQIPRTPLDPAAFRRGVAALIQIARRGNRSALLAALSSMDLGYRPVHPLPAPAFASAHAPKPAAVPGAVPAAVALPAQAASLSAAS